MSIDKTKFEGNWHYDMTCIENHMVDASTENAPISMPQYERIYESQTGTSLPRIHERWVEGKTLIKFLKWLETHAHHTLHTTVFHIHKAVKKDFDVSRKNSRKYRWDVAFRQKYTCNICKQLLHPKAFDIDHIIPLHISGQAGDTLDNMQALCCICHAKKTRTFTS